MKAALLFLTISSAALLCPAARATTTDETDSRQKASQTAPQASHRTAVTKPKSEVAPLPKPATPHRLTNNLKNLAAGKTVNADRQRSEQRNSPTNTSLRGNSNSFQQRSTRSSKPPRPAASAAPNNLRHHGPNPAVLGGPRNTTVTNTAALRGRAVHHRP
jgi:hypothetical protein